MMKKNKNKIIIAVLAIAVLTGMWFMSGTDNRGSGDAAPTISAPEIPSIEPAEASAAPISETPETTDAPDAETPADDTEDSESDDDLSTESAENAAETATEQPSATTSMPPETPVPTQAINPDTGKDIYLTDPVPEGRPLPVEPQDAVLGDGSFTVTLSVRCDTLLDNMDRLDKEKHELVPEDGIIFAATTVTVYEGESVFNVLQREMRRAQIHMEFVNTPIYNSAYIEGINNLYEFDGGELSGWMYKVNGWFPNYGCSRYQLQPGDVIEWVYTCDLGRDVGGFYATGG